MSDLLIPLIEHETRFSFLLYKEKEKEKHGYDLFFVCIENEGKGGMESQMPLFGLVICLILPLIFYFLGHILKYVFIVN